ncbi:MAG: arginine decarboxylase, partial [Clostridia bacterium]|nr:arginine decarboxylase [Clostridia bacterium]
VVMIVTFADTPEEISLIGDIAAYFPLQSVENTVALAKIPVPEAALSPRDAFFADKEKMPLKEAVGRIAGENIYIYPPGVPVIALGEKIDEISLEYLRRIRYNIDKETDVVV